MSIEDWWGEGVHQHRTRKVTNRRRATYFWGCERDIEFKFDTIDRIRCQEMVLVEHSSVDVGGET